MVKENGRHVRPMSPKGAKTKRRKNKRKGKGRGQGIFSINGLPLDRPSRSATLNPVLRESNRKKRQPVGGVARQPPLDLKH